MPVFVSNLQEKEHVDAGLEELLGSVAEEALRQAGLPGDPEVSLVLVDDAYIADLNRQYRGVDGSTDVLSFAMREGEPMPGEEEDDILGDVVISLETARRQAAEFGHGFTREVAYLAVHGVLHLLGYDHGTEQDKEIMRRQEEAVLARVLPGAGI